GFLAMRLRVASGCPVSALTLELSVRDSAGAVSPIQHAALAVLADSGSPPVEELSGRWVLVAASHHDPRHGCFIESATLMLTQAGGALTGTLSDGAQFCTGDPYAPVPPTPVT